MKSSIFFRYLFFGLLALASSPSISVALPDGNSITLTLADKTRANISIQGNNVIAQLQNGNTLVLVDKINHIPEYARDIWVEDFNFDGFQDIAITTQINQSSHEQLYTIFSWENSLKHFIPLHFAGSLSNLEIEPRSQQIRSSYQTGDFWTEDTYRFINKQPFLYSKSVLVASNIWHTTVYNQQQHIVRSLVSDSGKVNRPPHPVLLTVRNNNVPLYQQPLPSTKLPVNLKQGNVITIIDFKRGPGQFYWVNIRANMNNQMIQGWTLLSNLVQG